MEIIADRDRKLFEVFVRENEGSLMAYIRTFTRDRVLAEDLFQETMLTGWRRFDDFDTSQPLSPWLRGIAKNLIRNSWRKYSSDKLVFGEAASRMAESALAAIDEQPGDTWYEKLSALTDCVSLLPPKARALVRSTYTEGRSVKEIAVEYGLTAVAIRKRLQRIRDQLADCIGQRLGEPLR